MPNWAYNRIECQNEMDFRRLKECVLDEHGQMDFNRIIKQPKILDKMVAGSSRGPINAIADYLSHGEPMGFTETCRRIHEEYPNVRFITKSKSLTTIVIDAQTKGKKDVIDLDIEVPKLIAKASNMTESIADERDSYNKVCGNHPDSAFKNYAEYGKNALHCLLTYGYLDWYSWRCDIWGTKWNASETQVCDDDYSIYFETAWSPVIELMQTLSGKLRIPLYMEYAEEQFSVFAGEYVFCDGEVVEEGEYDYNRSGTTRELFKTASRMIDPDQEDNRITDDDEIVSSWDDENNVDDDGNPCQPFADIATIDVTSDMETAFKTTKFEIEY